MRRNEGIAIGPEVYLFGGLCLLLVPLPWLMAWVTAALVHELGHLGAIRLCGGMVGGFRLGLGGALLEVDGLTYGKELFCSLAGPICGLLLLLLVHRFPRLAVCALVQSVYNLLPVFPLDGGRALRSLLSRFLPLRAALASSKVVSRLTIVALFVLAVLLLRTVGQAVLLVPVCLLMRHLSHRE